MVKVFVVLSIFGALAVCSSTLASGARIEERYVTTMGPECKFCKTIVKQMFNFLRENRTEESVRDALDKICNLVYRDGPKRSDCDHFVSTYTRELIEILVDETDPELICMLLGQCKYEVSTRKTLIIDNDEKPTPKEMTPKEEKSVLPEKQQEVSLPQFISLLDPSVGTGSARTCVECKLFISYLQNTVQDPKSQDEIKEWLLRNLCDSLQEDSLKQSCTKMVNTNAKVFFDAIAQELDPKTTCVEFGACRRGLFFIDNFLPQQSAKQQKAQPAIETISSILDTILNSNIRSAYLEGPVVEEKPTKITTQKPPVKDEQWQEKSEEFVNKFRKAIETILHPLDKWNNEQKPESEVVEEIQPVVTSTRFEGEEEEEEMTPAQEKNSICDQCVEIVTKLDEYISSHSVDHDVDVLIDEVCNNIPQESLKNQCTFIVKSFGEEIIQAISSMKNPKELCSKIMLC